jgi:hypothetical protein
MVVLLHGVGTGLAIHSFFHIGDSVNMGIRPRKMVLVITCTIYIYDLCCYIHVC